jgi:isochorismate hydrolase
MLEWAIPEGSVTPATSFSTSRDFGAFHGTDLEPIPRSGGIDTVIISGVATHVSCETRRVEATVRDFHVFFLGEGTATFGIGDISAAEMQKATCATLGLAFAQVLTVDEMIRKIEGAAQAGGA